MTEKEQQTRGIVSSQGEKIYDEQIAPKLKEVGELCKSIKMGFAAIVEFDAEEGGIGVTVAPMPDDAGPAMRIAAYGMRCQGNVDDLIMALQRDGQKHGHSSLALTVLSNHESELKKH